MGRRSSRFAPCSFFIELPAHRTPRGFASGIVLFRLGPGSVLLSCGQSSGLLARGLQPLSVQSRVLDPLRRLPSDFLPRRFLTGDLLSCSLQSIRFLTSRVQPRLLDLLSRLPCDLRGLLAFGVQPRLFDLLSVLTGHRLSQGLPALGLQSQSLNLLGLPTRGIPARALGRR